MASPTDPRPPVVLAAGSALGVPLGAVLLASWWLDSPVVVGAALLGLAAVILLGWRPSGRPAAVGLICGTALGAIVLGAIGSAFFAPIGG